MAGQNESQTETTKQKLASFETILDEYTKKIGIGQITYNPVEVQKILDLSFEDISRLTEEECGAHEFILSKFALYLKREQNRQNVRVKWAERHLNSLLAKEGDKYGNSYVKYEVKLAAISNENSEAKLLSQIVLHAEARNLELDELASYINVITRALNDNRQTKRKFYGTNRPD